MISLANFRAGFLLACTWFVTGSLLADLPAETRWADPSSVQLNIEFPGDGYHASWELFRCDCGDLLVRAELNIPGEVETGELLLVAGQAVLTKGFGKYKAEAASSLDAAALMMQLALRLLERSEPGGPSRISGPLQVDLLDEINHIHLDTGAAEGGFQAPWSIAGEITAVGDTQRKFDLEFTFSAGAPGEVQQAVMRLSGLAEYAETEFPVPGSSDITEWDLSWRDEINTVAAKAETLDQLRALIRSSRGQQRGSE
jgi:hypothetical protein